MVKAKAFLFDVTTCALCGACWVADKERNNLPIPAGDFTQDELSDKSFLVVKKRQGRGVRFSCMHCVSPTCASLCPVSALEKTAIGAVIYHGERCIGCRYCVEACPFTIPKYEWTKPFPYVKKCDFCYSRITAGQMPACAAVCPTGALMFGNRIDLLQEARKRISADPSKYVDHIYGEKEVGGTSLLILSDIPLEKLGYPGDLSENPMPSLTWESLTEIPKVVLLGGTLLIGLWWLTKRRNEVYAAEHPEEKQKKPTENLPDGKDGK
jgi:formate dehydrogenase iron-sulfur subunit